MCECQARKASGTKIGNPSALDLADLSGCSGLRVHFLCGGGKSHLGNYRAPAKVVGVGQGEK